MMDNNAYNSAYHNVFPNRNIVTRDIFATPSLLPTQLSSLDYYSAPTKSQSSSTILPIFPRFPEPINASPLSLNLPSLEFDGFNRGYEDNEPIEADVSATIEAAENSAVLSNGLTLRRRRKRVQEISDSAKQYACNQCDKVFHRPYNLRSHMNSHSNEKPFSCKHCGRRFTRGHDKKRHELLHEGSKRFKCSGVLKDGKTKWGCNKTFARADALGRHFRTETGWRCIRPLMREARKNESCQSESTEVNLMAHQAIRRIKQDLSMDFSVSSPGLELADRSLYSRIGLDFNGMDNQGNLVIQDIAKREL